MSNIEEEFFHTFNISKQIMCSHSDTCYNGSVTKDCEGCNSYRYPEITAEILLKLICILNEHYCNNYQCATMLVGSTIEEVKKCILVECLENAKYIKDKVKSLFEEEGEE